MNPAVIIGLILLLLVGTGGGVYMWNRSQSKTTSPVVENTSQEKSSQKLLTWDDPAGFTFEYPEDVEIDKHEEDQENYAHVELTNSKHPGSIIIWAKDLPLDKKGIAIITLDEWLVTTPTFASASTLDTTLGGQSAKKVLLASPKSLIIGTIHDDLLWYVEGIYEDGSYWADVQTTIVGSFAFKPLEEEGTTTVNDSETAPVYEVAVDEEEVIE